jgi:AAA+ superfamily predicted ATPase
MEHNTSSNYTIDINTYSDEVNVKLISNNGMKYIHFENIDKNQELLNDLSDIFETDTLYEKNHKIPLDIIFNYHSQIKSKVESGCYELLSLLDLLNDEYNNKIEAFDTMSKCGKISFANITSLFQVGSKFVTELNGKLFGSIISNIKIEMDSFGNKYLSINANLYYSYHNQIKIASHTFRMGEFSGVKNIDDLSIRPANESDLEMLTNRGKKFIDLATQVCYRAYNGSMFRNTGFGKYNFNGTGRIMIDSKVFFQTNQNYNTSYSNGNNSRTVDMVLPDFYFMCAPTLYGFSLTTKQWGEIYVDDVSDINFRDDAFNKLVLDENRKKLIKALIENNHNTFSDIIDGKSGGCIFLLHGPPGVGKTLTCEAVSESLHKPLYGIGAGELGSTVEVLEKKLTNIIEIANSWNAIILIDECDIFMEKRNSSDILRNQMVAIFLRLLERHQGIMFLTTNRIDSMDEAFRSRISMILEYTYLTDNTKKQIWLNLLSASGINDKIDVDMLLSYNLNGRQIKSAIRMAQSIALSDNCAVNTEILQNVIEYL